MEGNKNSSIFTENEHIHTMYTSWSSLWTGCTVYITFKVELADILQLTKPGNVQGMSKATIWYSISVNSSMTFGRKRKHDSSPTRSSPTPIYFLSTPYERPFRSFRRRFFAFHYDVNHPHTNIILSWFGIPLVLKCAAKILKIGFSSWCAKCSYQSLR